MEIDIGPGHCRLLTPAGFCNFFTEFPESPQKPELAQSLNGRIPRTICYPAYYSGLLDECNKGRMALLEQLDNDLKQIISEKCHSFKKIL
jgi:hypothetical protein